jgi:hypothetical protein
MLLLYIFLLFCIIILFFYMDKNKQIDSYTSAQPTNLSPSIIYPAQYYRPTEGIDCTTDCPSYYYYPTKEKSIYIEPTKL